MSVSSSCLCAGYDDQLPPGVITSHAMMESASNTSAVAKLCTSRLQLPAPRNSIGTSSARMERKGSRRWARAPQSATRAPAALITRYALSRPTYAKSVGPWKTDCLPAKVKSRSPHDTVTEPDSGTTRISSSPDCRSPGSPAASSAPHMLDSDHPADSGVTATVNGRPAVDLAGR